MNLVNEQGDIVAEFADDQVSASDMLGGAYRKWREWEVELLAAAPKGRNGRNRLLDSIERVLVPAGALPSTSAAKLARALGVNSLREIAPARAPRPVPNSRSAASVVVWALSRLVIALEGADPAVRADQDDAVHEMRTIVRRMRGVLAGYSGLFDKAAVDGLRHDLKWLGAALGEARDAEVRGIRATKELDALQSQQAVDAARGRLVGGAQADYAEAHERVRLLLAGTRYYRLLDALDEFARNPPLEPDADRRAPGLIRTTVLRDVKRFSRRTDAVTAAIGDGSERTETALHEARKAARRLRHAIEAVTAKKARVFGTPARRKYRRIATAAKSVERSLGDRRDRLLFAEHFELSAKSAHRDGEEGFVYGLLAGRLERGDEAALRALDEAASRIGRLARKL